MTPTIKPKRDFRGHPLFSYGFRPFFLLSAIWAAIAIPLWIASHSLGPGAMSVNAGIVFHVHEMVFGYGSAVLAGFLLTAIPSWTGRRPVCGSPLVLLVLLWTAGRIAMVLGTEPIWIVSLIEAAFLVVLAGLVWREIIAGHNGRNLKVAAAVTALAVANIGFHAVVLTSGGLPQMAIRAGLSVLIFLILLVGGRITPTFTRNWLAGQSKSLPAQHGKLDDLCLILSLGALAGWTILESTGVASVLLVVSGLLNVMRLLRWRGELTMAEPLLIALHVGYLWTASALVLIGLAGLAPAHVPAVAGTHAAGAGAVGVMTLAVMTRASLGHTGRALHAGSGTVAIYALVNLGALIRVAAPFLDSPIQSQANHWAAALWAGGFAGFALLYGPRLIGARIAPPA